MSNMVIYEMSDLRGLLKKFAPEENVDLNQHPFSQNELKEIEKMASSIISGGKVSIGNRQAFVAYFISQCRLVPTFTLQAPMACNVTTRGIGSRMNIYYNPIRMAYKAGIQEDSHIFLDSFESVGNVLLHEAQHLLYNHLDTYESYLNMGYGDAVNIATDCQINQDPIIMADQVLMDYGISLDSVKEMTQNPGLKARQDSQYYFTELVKSASTGKGSGDSNSNGSSSLNGLNGSNGSNDRTEGQGDGSASNGDTPSDGGDTNSQDSDNKDQAKRDARVSHSVWKKMPKDLDEEKVGNVAGAGTATQTITDGVKKAIEQGGFDASDIKDRGLVAGDIIDSIISGRNRRTKLPIKHFLRKGIGKIKCGYSRTYSRVHRQQASNIRILRGKKKETIKNIHLFYDTSGSVSQEELEWTFQEIAGLAYAAKADLYAMPFDARVYPDTVAKIDKKGNYHPEIKGRGGTCFQPIFDYLHEEKRSALVNNDLIVIFTDGGGERTVDMHNFRNVIWVLIGQDRDVLSVESPIGMLCYLEDDKAYQIYKMKNRR